MTELDLVVRSARLPGRDADDPVDLGIADGTLAEIGAFISSTAREEINARGLHVFPGAVDPHVHFNEPGARAHWEGFASGSSALAAGGVTTALEMPLNASPPTVDCASFDAKRAVAERESRVDFGLWAGVVPGNFEQLEALAHRGAVGFKAFMSTSGVLDFPACDDLTLYEAMLLAARLGIPVAVHAENEAITRGLAERARARDQVSIGDYLRSRPAIAETEAIARAIELASEAGCALHVVHVSTGRGVALVAEARARGVDVTCEVTPHHLLLNEGDVERLGMLAKCAPPLRSAAENAALWRALRDETVTFVASDHSPVPPELRTARDAFAAWGGIAGCQSTLELLLTEGHHKKRLSLERIADVLSRAVARRFRLTDKGALDIGSDADLVLVDLAATRVLDAGELRYRHAASPYVGHTLKARVACTILRGAPIYAAGRLVGSPRGQFVRPAVALRRRALQKPSR
ncbi:MAG: allantoinase AllB [Actinomycetota bacterium]|nr:allantoinase AllB [Actinomycetota bacterium]